MSHATKRTIAWCFSALGVLFMLALAFPVMPGRYAIFAGTACFVLSGMTWAFPSSDQ